jgi:hypothetical protein
MEKARKISTIDMQQQKGSQSQQDSEPIATSTAY